MPYSPSIYESGAMREIAGDMIRPGGLILTDTALKYCEFKKNDPVLDIGCGIGTTAAYLRDHHGLDAVGIDPSDVLLKEGKEKYPHITLLKGRGEELPFNNESMKGVFNECTLSLMDNLYQSVKEVRRVLKPDGMWVISDVYAHNPERLKELRKEKLKSCIRGMFDLCELENVLKKYGFSKVFCRDYTDYLKEFMVKAVFSHGSIEEFWRKASNSCKLDFSGTQEKIKLCKPGYFMMILQKK